MYIRTVILAIFLAGCTSTTELEIEHKQEPFKVVLPERSKAPMFNSYSVDFIEYKNYKCFDKQSADQLNENYFKMWNHVKDLRRENEYLRSQIKALNP